MSKIKQVDYGHINWGPFVMRTKLPDYIIKRLLKDGNKLKKENSLLNLTFLVSGLMRFSMV